MRILYITPYVPNPIRVRPYNFVRTLAQHGHQVTLAALWERPEERQTLEAFRAQGVEVITAPLTQVRRAWNGIRALPTSMPLQAEFCNTPEFRRLLFAACQTTPFDIIHVEHLRGAEYGIWLGAQMHSHRLNKRIPIVWDSVDCISYLFQQAMRQSASLRMRLMTRIELGRTRRYESRVTTRFEHVFVASHADKSAFEALLGTHGLISVLPNGVDLDYFCPGDPAQRQNSIVFSGKMSYHANVTAAHYLATQVMPLVWAVRPDMQLIIAGSRPPKSLVGLATEYPGRVTVTGYLPDLREPLHQASIAAAPLLYGAGVQNKVLEAMACATPVVATSRAVHALAVKPGTDCLVADTPQAFADAVLLLLKENAMRLQMGAAGRCYVETNHNWHVITTQMESIYAEILRKNSTS
jgi:glycosyltransferase involved in cell wall biosynthesis